MGTWAVSSGTFELPLKDYANITIDWGDSSTSTHTNQAFPTHTYSSSGTYTITIRVNDAAKDIGEMYLSGHASRTLITTITNWGEGKWETFNHAFIGATNLTIPATDEPDLSLADNMVNAFHSCTSLVGTTFNDWNVSTITNMSSMFKNAEDFNGNISGWNTAAVTDMSAMFSAANSFNQDLSSWDVSNVTNMGSMFSGAKLFNKDISSWDVSNVLTMYSMFSGATAFNQYIGSWDVSNVNNMYGMFRYASAFNQDISSWDKVGNF